MKIRTQLTISIVLFALAVLIIAASMVLTSQQVDKLSAQQDLVKNIELGAAELGYLSNDYLLYNETQQLDRWNSKFAEFSGEVSNLSVNTPEQQALVDTIRASRQRLKDVFGNVAATLNDQGITSDGAADKAYIQVSWSRMAVQTRGIIFDASRLSQMLQDQETQVKQTNTLMILTLMGAFVAFLLIDYLLIFGRGIKAIANLQAGTKIIGSGNLDYAIKTNKTDEIGELADAFNQMTARLKTVTTSKADLEREVTERKKVEEALRLSADRLGLALDAAKAGNWEWDLATNKNIWSEECWSLYGLTPHICEPSYDAWLQIIHPRDRERVAKAINDAASSEAEFNAEWRVVDPDGKERWLMAWGRPLRDARGQVVRYTGIVMDVSERKRADVERENAVEYLRIVNGSKGKDDLIRTITAFVQDKSGCEAVGIRLRKGDDYPYFETRGFSKEFVRAETSLCLRDNTGLPVCDGDGYPILECMCGNVIRGRFDPSKPFFSPRGSFWSNNTTQLLATTTEADRQARTRNRCNGEGYESVAVIPIRLGTGCLGLLQMNDRRTGRFTPETIAMWERLTDYLAVALAKFEADDATRRQADLINLSPDAIMVRKLDGTITYWAHGAEDLYGFSREEAIGRSVHTLLKTQFPEPLEEIDRKLGETNIWTGELGHSTRDGHLVIVQSRWQAQRDENGGISEVFESNMDITGRRQVESAKEQLLNQLKARTAELQDVNEEVEVKNEELAAQTEELECTNEELRTHNDELQSVTRSLHETQDYLEKLINYANAPIIVWDPNFTIIRFNRAFERLTGYLANEILGKHLSILFPQESKEETLDKIKKTLEGEQWESVEIPILHKYGSVRIALWNSANIYAENGTLQTTIAQGQDITRRKRAEKDLEDAKIQAELYLDLMGHDISNMHQIMLMQLELAADILKMEGKLEGNDKELIESSVRTLDKAARLINNVRKLQKHQSGEFSLEPVDLTEMLKDVLKDYADLPGKEVSIRFTPDGRSLVQANPLLKDVFNNLVDNAVKHSGGPLALVVNISKISVNGSAFYRVAIEDNGNGIPDDKKEEVFHRFKRGQTKARGTGLGLYIVKTLVEGFGGYVEIQNRVLEDYTKGTRFLVYLPVMEEEDAGNN